MMTDEHVGLRHETFDPAHPDERVGSFALLTSSEAGAAVQKASEIQESWASSAQARAAALDGWAGAIEASAMSIATLVAREVGKPIREARAEVGRATAILRYYAQMAFDASGEIYPAPPGAKSLYVERRPLGLVAAICPWNFPVAIPIWKIAPALTFGNAVLFKPSRSALAVGSRLVELGQDHLPPGVLSLMPMDNRATTELLKDARLHGVSFTGSAHVARAIVGPMARLGLPVQAEMGGQNPSLVLDDADFDLSAKTIAGAAMAFAGQKCTATSRVIVLRSVAGRFTTLLVEAIRQLNVGEPLEDITDVGPLISQQALVAVADAVRGAISRGGRLIAGGVQLERPGWFFAPTLIALDNPMDPFAQEETFGPVTSLIIVDTVDEAVHVANATSFGLSAAVFGADIERATRVASRIEAGILRINSSTTGVDYWVPFGGAKDSSYGPREQGKAAREFYTRTRTISIA